MRLANDDILLTHFVHLLAVTVYATLTTFTNYRVAETVLTNSVQQELIPESAALTRPAVAEFFFNDVSRLLVIGYRIQIGHRKVVLGEEILNFSGGVGGLSLGIDGFCSFVEPLQFLQFRKDGVDVLCSFHNNFVLRFLFQERRYGEKSDSPREF